MPKIIKLKKKPTKPTLETVSRNKSLSCYGTVQDLIKTLQEFSPEATYSITGDEWIGGQFEVSYFEEDEGYYRACLASYQKKMKEYNEWYEENKEDVDYTIAEKKRITEEKKEQEREKKMQRLRKELDKLEKEGK